MPNHVTHRVVITGPAETVAQFKNTFIVTTRDRDDDGVDREFTRLDFEVLVPMPEAIRNTESSSTVSDGLLILGRPAIRDDFGLARTWQEQLDLYLSYAWVREAGVTDFEGLKSLLLARSPGCLEKARHAVEAYDNYGHTSWYSWSLAHWGTKWNSYDFEMVSDGDDRLEFLFNTAWSSPEPIFAALAGRPEAHGLTITVHGFDEGWNFAFVGSIRNGHYLGEYVEASEALYQQVYARPAPAED
ncbi:hypothetical protein [Chelativorans sp. AA-79]|uniref:hypothetical protein n=1 Tax=Chelativorans sp. AA-79 TaxID=3028735 RepID=UPI0023F8FBE0|nr:hypothetical protein [Chelativorans sp. AA-79]WEX12371.1 hypothetical protein PVE73_27140 [Chelativorans sp. AA-79]